MNHTDHTHHCSVHDHHDIETRLTEARILCERQGGRFTTLRQDIYRLILSAGTPVGAYDLMSALQTHRQTGDNAPKKTNIAPPTVYRSLEFLLSHGLIHQLNSINAYIPCCHPRENHAAAFLICQKCNTVEELSNFPVTDMIEHSQKHAQFLVKKSTIELAGICRDCQA